MGQTLSFSDKLHECLCNNDRAQLQVLLKDPEFTSVNITDDMLVDLVERQWNNDVILAFVAIASDDQLATLIATVVLHSNVFPIDRAFAQMKNKEKTIAAHHLTDLFLFACDHADTPAVTALIKHKCFDAADPRSITVAFRREADKGGPDADLLKTVLAALPGQTETAQYVLDEIVSHAKSASTQKLMKEMLKTYMAA